MALSVTKLQIGDWVRSSFFGAPVRIKSINFKDGYGWVNTTLVPDTKSDASLFPILLTPEILEKNGFVSVDDGCKCVRKWSIGEYTYAYMSFDFNVEVDILNGVSSFLHIIVPQIDVLGMPLYYVHTLQHTLRLCGLDELANDFQI